MCLTCRSKKTARALSLLHRLERADGRDAAQSVDACKEDLQMSVALTGVREAAQSQQTAKNAGAAADSTANERHSRARRTAPSHATQPASGTGNRYATDNEILGISSALVPARVNGAQTGGEFDANADGARADSNAANEHTGAEQSSDASAAEAHTDAQAEEQLQAALNAHPELRRAWQEAESYREAFATPEEARAATALLGDLDRMDALFFSHRPEDHTELARAVANLDPAAFASLAQAMSNLAAGGLQAAAKAQETGSGENQQQIPRTPSRGSDNQSNTESSRDSARNGNAHFGPTPAQLEFLHAANAAAVQGVLDAVETQVDRLLPDGVSKTARNRVVGEIYRELDASLGANRQLGQQMRDALRSGSLDAQHQRAIVGLVTGRARQALPGIAKRVLTEWTSTVVAANQDRLARQRAAAHRVDIAGAGRGADGGRRSLGPRDIDYTRMSDSDILNL
jgi:hypothetical protein